jgi:hypothetical protein
MRKASGLIFVLVFGIASAAAQAPPEKGKTADYYPLKPGTKWFYELNTNGQKIKLNNQVAKIENIDGKSLALVETVINGTVSATEHMQTTDKGVFRHRINGIELTPPVCILKYPFKKDETWEVETTVGAEKLTIKAKAVDSEEVTVPAGKYKALKADVDTTVMGMQVSATYWFAPEVGVVKQTMVIQGKDITLELDKFEAGK